MNAFAQEDSSFLSSYDKYWEIDDGFYRVMSEGKIGLVNSMGDIIIPCENDQVWNLQDNGDIKVLKNGKLGIYNTNGDILIPVIYDMIWGFEDGKARVMRDGKIGYVNRFGNEFIPCKYDQIWNFEDGKAKVLKNGKVGYVNLSGYEFIPAEYQKIWDFEDGKARVLKNGKMGLINIQGVEIIACQYQHLGEFEEGVARVVKDGKIAYVDMNGNPVERNLEDEEINSNTQVHESNKELDSSHADEDTTTIKFFGSKVDIIEEKGATRFSFDKETKKEWSDYKKKRIRSFDPHYFGIDFGLNSYVNAEGDFAVPADYDYLSLHTGKSFEFSVNALEQNVSLSRRGNVGFVTGLGLTFNNYRFERPFIPVSDEEGNLSSEEILDPLEKNKLTSAYLNMPLLFELQFSRRRNDAFYISAGVMGEYRLQSHTKVVFKKDGERIKDKNRDDFGLNDFRYGAQVRFGFKELNFFGKYYLSSLFEDGKGPELYPVSFGVCFYPDNW